MAATCLGVPPPPPPAEANPGDVTARHEALSTASVMTSARGGQGTDMSPGYRFRGHVESSQLNFSFGSDEVPIC